MKLYCVGCNKEFPLAFKPFCDECHSMTEIRYDLENVRLRDSTNPYIRFIDLLPITDQSLLPDTTYTPLVHAKNLGAEIGLDRLYLKDETVNPTNSTKDRMAVVALAYLYESGIREFCTASTGNSASAFARAIQYFPEMHMYLFTSEDWSNRVHFTGHDQVSHFVIRNETFVGACNCSKQFAQTNGIPSESGFFNPGKREGLKLAYLEALDQIEGEIDYYFQASSSAMGVVGTYKASKDMLEAGFIKTPLIPVCVQEDTCQPMVNAWQDKADHIREKDVVENPTGLAKAILRGDPRAAYPYVYKMLRESGGTLLGVSQDEIIEARALTSELEGIEICHSAAVSVAGAMKMARQSLIESDKAVLVNLTGKDRQGPVSDRYQYVNKIGENWHFEKHRAPMDGVM